MAIAAAGANQLRAAQQSLQLAREGAVRAQDAAATGDLEEAVDEVDGIAEKLHDSSRHFGGVLALPL